MAIREKPRTPATASASRLAATGIAVLLAAGAIAGCSPALPSLIEVHHAPALYSRRAVDFTANVTGRVAPGTRSLEWRINGGAWRRVGRAEPRTPPPQFTVEIAASDLRPGRNEIELRARAWWRPVEQRRFTFHYDPAPVSLPLHVEWTRRESLDVQDGAWEVTADGRLRPVPGQEGFDRIVAVTGAFDGGRRVETEVVFRSDARQGGWGFGIFPLWGGNPDQPGQSPRRGWRFSLLWYASRIGGHGCEFSEKIGDEDPRWVSMYRNIDLEAGISYRLVTETWAEHDPGGRHLRWRQRCKWWRSDAPEPSEWTSVSDDLGAPLPPGPYAVAVFALRSQVEFGPVIVTALHEMPP